MQWKILNRPSLPLSATGAPIRPRISRDIAVVIPHQRAAHRVMCTGMVDPKYRDQGAFGRCRRRADKRLPSRAIAIISTATYKARRRIKLLKAILPQYGFDEKRVKLTWIGASDGIQFAATIRDMVTDIKALGPSEARHAMVI
jgi:F420-non-reducing hydrogenase iron-sulfur subunit